MKLPEVDVEEFELFVTWLSNQSFWSTSDDDDSWPSFDCLVKLYVFADMVQVPSLMNQTLDTLRHTSDLKRTLPHRSTLSFAWENTTAQSPLRRLIVDWVVWEFHISSINEDWVNELPAECISEVLKAMRRVVKRYDETAEGEATNPLLSTSDYHVPEKEEKSSS